MVIFYSGKGYFNETNIIAKWVNIVSLGNMNEYRSYECSSTPIIQPQ
jgi:hypothetical protein